MKKKNLHSLFQYVERYFDRIKRSQRNRKAASEGFQILCYNGCHNKVQLLVKGRVLGHRDISKAAEDDNVFTNIHRAYQLFHSKEISQVSLTVNFDGKQYESTTDDEGYFEFKIPLKSEKPEDNLWREIAVQHIGIIEFPLKELSLSQGPVKDTQYIVISDIDDTILQSGVHSMLTMIKNTFAKNAKTRLSFEGVAELYHKLQQGLNDHAVNPIFYLSNSPWNLYEFLVEFMRLNDIPKGTLFLRDYGIDEKKWFKDDGHKLRTIRKLLNEYPDQQFILIGDNGEKDPEYYHEIANKFPERIKAIYIRNVTDEIRKESVDVLISELEKIKVPMLLVDESMGIERHAKSNSWIH